ncbi:MAG TPA: hypothetical protein VFJ82_08505 [Longimicrobium sp.]|nr:hypothetical protein [Longimicrobium sp.]
MRGYDRGYDYGLRGWPQARGMREPVRTRFTGGYDGGFRGFRAADRDDIAYGSDYDAARRQGLGYRLGPPPNRVTARYNLDYVREQHPGERPVNYAPYGGDRIDRVGDLRAYHGPYQTVGGTRTWRGEWPMGWEHSQSRYGMDYPNYRNDYGRWF